MYRRTLLQNVSYKRISTETRQLALRFIHTKSTCTVAPPGDQLHYANDTCL